MLDPKTLEEIGNKMSALLAKLDVVTREEFDIQTHVLARTREKLKELEARVEALEKARAAK